MPPPDSPGATTLFSEYLNDPTLGHTQDTYPNTRNKDELVIRELWEFACDCINCGESTIDFDKFNTVSDLFDIKAKR